MIDKLAQPLDALLIVIHSGVDEFLQILQTRFGLISLFGLERVFVTGFEDGGFDDVGDWRIGICDCGLRALPNGRATAPF